jgi:hypothetical protein
LARHLAEHIVRVRREGIAQGRREGIEEAAAWSFDLEAYRDHFDEALVALRVTSDGHTDWHVYYARQDDEDGTLRDPSSGDDIGWHADDVEAWRLVHVNRGALLEREEAQDDG